MSQPPTPPNPVGPAPMAPMTPTGQAPYPTGPAPLPPYPAGPPYPAAAGPPVVLCRACACAPAVKATFRGHRGMILFMQFRSLEGPFCRDCGVAAFRLLQADTMWQGWWGAASFFITPVVLVVNVVLRNRVTALAPPQPNPWGTSRRPMSPGRPVLLRPGGLIGLIPLAGALILAYNVALAALGGG